MTYQTPSVQPDQVQEAYADHSDIAPPQAEAASSDNGFVWNEIIQDRLRELWDQGLAASQIAAELGISRNAVIGKAHRLGLAGRASPIKRDKSPKLTLVALKERMCRWPINHPGDPDFHFCGGEASGSSPYCDDHHARAYITTTKRVNK